ncbi:MAG: two-component regulator propeller domain-containing protein [Planctomycetota bacterium]
MLYKKSFGFLAIWISLAIACQDSHAQFSPIPKKRIGQSDSSFRFAGKVATILQARDGSYWIGSNEDGLCKFDGEQYTYFTTDDGLTSNSVRDIQESSNSDIWINNRDYVTKFDGNRFRKFLKPGVPRKNILEQPIALSQNDLWFSDDTRLGVYRFCSRRQRLTFLSFSQPSLGLKKRFSRFFISDTTRLVNGRIWFGTLTQGAVGTDGNRFFRITNEDIGFSSERLGLHIRSALLDSKGTLWLGNNGAGVVTLKNGRLSHFSEAHKRLLPIQVFDANTNEYSRSKNTGLQSVFAIEEDSDGNIWFGDRDSGAWRYDGKKLVNFNAIYKTSSMGELITEIYCDRKGLLYFVLGTGEVRTFNDNSFNDFNGF